MIHLLLCLLFSGKTIAAWSGPVQKVPFSPKLDTRVELHIGYPPKDEANPVIERRWKKCGDKQAVILRQENSKSPEYYGSYRNRTQYYFNNNTLILHNVLEEDKGIYEVRLLYQNNTIWTRRLHLHLIVPPPNPTIKVDTNYSHMTLVLRCEVESGKDLSYHWLKSGQLLPRDERHSLGERNSTLLVNNLTIADCVNYTCVAANGQVRSEGHIQLNGSVIETCTVIPAPALTLKGILSITIAAICVFGLCSVILCIRKRQEIRQWLRGYNSNKKPASSQRGQRTTNEADVAECHMYDEIWEQEGHAMPAVREGQLVCVYTDFIPNCHGARSGPRPELIEDFGYSTIE